MSFYDTDPVRFVILVVLLLLLASGVWKLHRNGRELLRNALIWIALFLLVAGIYQWFNPLADVDLSGPWRDV